MSSHCITQGERHKLISELTRNILDAQYEGDTARHLDIVDMLKDLGEELLAAAFEKRFDYISAEMDATRPRGLSVYSKLPVCLKN